MPFARSCQLIAIWSGEIGCDQATRSEAAKLAGFLGFDASTIHKLLMIRYTNAHSYTGHEVAYGEVRRMAPALGPPSDLPVNRPTESPFRWRETACISQARRRRDGGPM